MNRQYVKKACMLALLPMLFILLLSLHFSSVGSPAMEGELQFFVSEQAEMFQEALETSSASAPVQQVLPMLYLVLTGIFCTFFWLFSCLASRKGSLQIRFRNLCLDVCPSFLLVTPISLFVRMDH